LRTQAVEPTPESPVEIHAFARLMRAHTVLRRELESEVLTPRGLTFNDFEALLHLGRADDNRLRRIDLAELLMLSPSGVTRLLDGLVESGMIENVSCADDARVTWAKLTVEGVSTLECVGVNHTKVMRSLFQGSLDEAEVEQLSELLGKLPGVGEGSCSG
jgi:DNA-binding MarR family transcriptional regulator